MEDSSLAKTPCPLCGKDTLRGRRYCGDCDSAGVPSAAQRSAVGMQSAPRGRRRGDLPLILLFFFVAAFGTVMLGMAAPEVLPMFGALPGFEEPEPWGEVRYARTTSRIRSAATTASEIVGKLAPGDSVRVEPTSDGWFAVYLPETGQAVQDEATPIGFVYGKLLELPADEPSGDKPQT